MFANRNSEINKTIKHVLAHMRESDPTSEEFKAMNRELSCLASVKDATKPSGPSADAILAVAANLIGILIIVNHENVNVISSKALGFVTKPQI